MDRCEQSSGRRDERRPSTARQSSEADRSPEDERYNTDCSDSQRSSTCSQVERNSTNMRVAKWKQDAIQEGMRLVEVSLARSLALCCSRAPSRARNDCFLSHPHGLACNCVKRGEGASATTHLLATTYLPIHWHTHILTK